MARGKSYPETPDGRYFVAKGRLWRRTDPRLPDAERKRFVKRLMQARLAVRDAPDDAALREARAKVDAAKRALGERGPVWWDDGMDPVDRKKPENTPYADWWAALPEEEKAAGR